MSGEVAVLGAGMHPWGKWGRGFVEYGVVAARAALADAGVDWRDIGSVVGADTVRGRLSGVRGGSDVREGPGLAGSAGHECVRRLCVGGAGHQRGASADPFGPRGRGPRGRRRRCAQGILPSGGRGQAGRSRLAAVPGPRSDEPDVLRAVRAAADGRARGHPGGLRAGQGEERRPGGAEPERAVPQEGHGRRGGELRRRRRPAAAARHLCDVRRGAALVLSSMDFARRHGAAAPYGSARCRR